MMISIPFPTSTGYLNFGDSLVMISGLLLGPVGGFFAGGVGSAVADVALGFGHFAPITFVVKGIEGLLVGLLSAQSKKSSTLTKWDITGILLGAIAMLAGYFYFEYVLFGLVVALEELLLVNWIQVTAGGIIAAIVGPTVRKYLSDFDVGGTEGPVEIEHVAEESVVHLRKA